MVCLRPCVSRSWRIPSCEVRAVSRHRGRRKPCTASLLIFAVSWLVLLDKYLLKKIAPLGVLLVCLVTRSFLPRKRSFLGCKCKFTVISSESYWCRNLHVLECRCFCIYLFYAIYGRHLPCCRLCYLALSNPDQPHQKRINGHGLLDAACLTEPTSAIRFWWSWGESNPRP